MKLPIEHIAECIFDADGAVVFATAYYRSPEECRSALDQIVLAVNSHDELVQQRDKLLAACNGYVGFKACRFCRNGEMCELCADAYQELHEKAIAAIAKAEGRQ